MPDVKIPPIALVTAESCPWCTEPLRPIQTRDLGDARLHEQIIAICLECSSPMEIDTTNGTVVTTRLTEGQARHMLDVVGWQKYREYRARTRAMTPEQRAIMVREIVEARKRAS